ncbi:glycosyl-phosphatidylinositol-anchored molecule-like protein [Nycticebus coucang]|uniref:glycosyl-phosphatidylinositol-anchored molecule-like protein n=1 Tax=Nycticebus coucang TaxID=9470 RepID=UPI00234D075B|nr:glycosyl-phosphatidylinositol-anchored molecule-like protein [Nycticebus coucang]XP_053415295.1 glycosyl-phosphatidylinositol-anchored molecule-like protein [Nycticebus coucang]
MMLPFALLLAMGLPLVGTNITDVGRDWTFNLKCQECSIINDFNCDKVLECPYHIRRCLIISIRLNPRELFVFKNCTFNCTFVYESQMPPETPRKRYKANSFYFVRCCSGMLCNTGGPTNVERDLVPEGTIEEELPDGAMSFWEWKYVPIFACIIVSNTLT